MNTIPPRAPVDYLTHLAAYLVRLTHPAHLTRPEYPEYPEYLEYLRHLEHLEYLEHLAAGDGEHLAAPAAPAGEHPLCQRLAKPCRICHC